MSWSVAQLASRMAALTILVAVVIGLSVGLAVPLFERHRANEQRLAGERERLARLRDFIARNTKVEASAVEDKAIKFPDFIEGQTPALQVAALQDIVVKALLLEQIKPRATRALPAEERAGLKRVGVQVELTTGLERLIRVISDLSHRKEQLSVEGMRISPQSPRDQQRRDLVDARLTIYGFTSSKSGRGGG